MKVLKKLGLILLVFALLISVAGCENATEKAEIQPTETEKYVAENGERLASNFEKGFSAGENQCKTVIKAKGNEIIFDINLAGFENLDEESKKEVQMALDAMKELLKESFKNIKEEIPSLEKVFFNMNEETGTNMASIEIEY